MIRWLEANGYDVTYFTGVDSDRRGLAIRSHQVFLSVGHDEYWSAAQRANVEAARDAGIDLAFFSRQDGVLEDPVGNQYRRIQHALPHARVLQGDARERQDRPVTERLDRHVAGPALQSPGGRRAAGERAHGQHLHCQWPGTYDRHRSPGPLTRRLRFWRNTPVAGLAPGQTADAGRRDARV